MNSVDNKLSIPTDVTLPLVRRRMFQWCPEAQVKLCDLLKYLATDNNPVKYCHCIIIHYDGTKCF